MSTFCEEFAEKSDLPRAFDVTVGHDEHGTFLRLGHPVALARFVGYVKARVRDWGAAVYLRGQTQAHAGMVPSLFRGAASESSCIAFLAYQEAQKMIQSQLPYGRFIRDNPGALFQHYGLRTPWLDLVDNLYTAVWFATHSGVRDRLGRACFLRSESEVGWLYLVTTRSRTGDCLHSIDLRSHHSSMCVRLQSQHGLSVASQQDSAELLSTDYQNFVVGRIEIPNGPAFRIDGGFGSPSFYFPDERLDETFAILVRSPIDRIVAECEEKFGLTVGALGRILRLRRRRPRRTTSQSSC